MKWLQPSHPSLAEIGKASTCHTRRRNIGGDLAYRLELLAGNKTTGSTFLGSNTGI